VDVSRLLAVLAVVCALTALGFGVAVANYLRERGHRANPLFVKWMVFRYLATYRRVTLEETGQVGRLHYGCSVASAWAVILAVAAILVRVL